ncbi:MAG: FAD-binding oxidoreductase, partial [Kiritimatiellia bacterium]|nr:FAD-binding oxidoreductase [Kiritimatiellia bacterium]
MPLPAPPRSDALSDFLACVRRTSRAEIREDPVSLLLYSTDASIFQAVPLAIAVPQTREDVSILISEAARRGIPVLPRVSGTSLAGQAVNEAVVIDVSRHLDRIVDIDPSARTARVEPGVILDDLNAAARPHGLQYGPDPASSDRASLGGIVGNNATGAHSLLYGMT